MKSRGCSTGCARRVLEVRSSFWHFYRRERAKAKEEQKKAPAVLLAKPKKKVKGGGR